MTITRHQQEEVLILAPGKKLTFSETGDELSEAVRQALEEGIRKFLFDFSAVEFIDSLGVGQIVSSYTSIKKKEGHLVLCGLQPRIALVLRMVNLHFVLDIKDGGPGEVIWT